MRFNICVLSLLWGFQFINQPLVLAQDTLIYKQNARVFPVIEGGSIGYEYVLGKWNDRYSSIKGQMVFRKNDMFSNHNGSENFRERSLQIEYRKYLKKNTLPMNGIFHGFAIHASHFEGEVSSFMLDEMTSQFEIIPVWGRAISAGYIFGYQKMTKSGFNVDFGYSMRIQQSAGYDFEAYWLDLIPFRPYVTGMNSRVFCGVGLAF